MKQFITRFGIEVVSILSSGWLFNYVSPFLSFLVVTLSILSIFNKLNKLSK